MPTIHNKTKLPLTVPLPGGKKLRLGPLASGKIAPKAVEHGAVKRLVEEGKAELTVEDQRGSGPSGSNKGIGPGRGPTTGAGGGVQHTGDR